MRGQRPEEVEYRGSAESLQQVWVALRANLRKVLEHVTLADIAAGKLPKRSSRSPARGSLADALGRASAATAGRVAGHGCLSYA